MAEISNGRRTALATRRQGVRWSVSEETADNIMAAIAGVCAIATVVAALLHWL